MAARASFEPAPPTPTTNFPLAASRSRWATGVSRLINSSSARAANTGEPLFVDRWEVDPRQLDRSQAVEDHPRRVGRSVAANQDASQAQDPRRIPIQPQPQILSAFGDDQLRYLDRMAIEAWIADLQASGLGPPGVRRARQVLHAMLTLAVDAGYLPANPVDGTSTPRIITERLDGVRFRERCLPGDDCGTRGRARLR